MYTNATAQRPYITKDIHQLSFVNKCSFKLLGKNMSPQCYSVTNMYIYNMANTEIGKYKGVAIHINEK